MRIFYSLLLFCCSQFLTAQSFDDLVKKSPVFVEEVNLQLLRNNQLYISMPFAKELVLNPEQQKILNEKAIIKIELVYTKYRTVSSFNQQQLNKSRLVELEKLVPQLFESRLWEFELISQTNGNSREICNKMFHGFIITFRPNSTAATLNLEANYLSDLVDAMIKKDSVENDTTPLKYNIKTHFDQTWGYIHDTIWYVDTVSPVPPPNFFYNQALYQDSTVLNAFYRNDNWNNFIVVTDMTGSMSPYNAQVFVWLKAQAENKKAKYFVFFNDGDQLPSRKKKPLETKGIYLSENTSLKSVIDTATKCMRSGSGGGESMENDIEAIIEGLKYYPKAEAVILVADNLEIMRDYDFIKKVKVPVHDILCGANNRINVQYLDLAKQTGGTLHTSISDVINLQTLKEGEHFFIDDKEYMYKHGRFHSIY